MARIERYQPGGLSVGGSFNLPDRVRPITERPPDQPFRPKTDYVGRALEALGGAVASLGADLGQLAATRQATADASWFSKARAQTAVDWLEKESELRTGATTAPSGPAPASPAGGALAAAGYAEPGWVGFTGRAIGEFETYRDGVLKSAPSPAARQAYEEWANGFGAQIAERAFQFEEASLFAQRADDLNTAFDAHVKAVYQSPDQYDTVLARAYDDLEGAKAWMTPEQEIEARRKIEESLQLARAKKLAQFDPLRFQEEVGLASGPISTTAAKIIGVESAGNARAKNPRSSASGLGQFTDATWLETVRRHRPELTNLSDKDILTLKADPALAREMTIRHTEDNAAALQASGIEPTEGNLYLAHFAGIGGARAVLGASDDTAIVDVLGAEAVRANPFLQGKTVGWLKQWAAAKMAGTTPAEMGDFTSNPYYSRLSPDQVFSLAHDADSAILAQHNAAVAEAKAIYGARFNSLMTAIMDGGAGLADIQQARRDGWLADYQDIKKATDAVTARDKDAVNTAKAVARFNDPGDRFNPFVSEDRAAADLAYKAFGGATALSTGDTTATGRLIAFAERTGIIPDSAADALKVGIISRDAGERTSSFQTLSGLWRQYPEAVANAFDETTLKRIQDYEALSPITPPDELAQRLDPNSDPTRRKLVADLRAEGAKLAADVPTDDILWAFAPSWWDRNLMWESAAAAPIDPIATATLRSDFAAIFAERYAVSGDAEVAKRQTLERLKNGTTPWGVTESGDTPRLMRFPPERYYPAVNGDHDYLADQLAEAVRAHVGSTPVPFITSPADALLGNVAYDATSWSLIEAPETAAAVRAGDLPGYWVTYVDHAGTHHLITEPDGSPMLMTFDMGARDDARAQFEADRAAGVTGFDMENARRKEAGLPPLKR